MCPQKVTKTKVHHENDVSDLIPINQIFIGVLNEDEFVAAQADPATF